MAFEQIEINITAQKRGFNLITNKIIEKIPQIKNYQYGVLYLFIKHTSASLSINENADSTVRDDLESYFNKFVPENENYYKHTCEGPDDMPAHIKSTILGSSLTIPISKGALNLGTWQGIYLCEHRSHIHLRNILATINGDKF